METAKTSTPTPAPAPAAEGKERRRTSRFFCEGIVEINRVPSTGKRQGKLKDLSQAGCYIEMADPFAAPSYIEIMIDTGDTKLRLAGTVKNSRKTGMGVEFAKIGSSARMLLEDLIIQLERHAKKGAN